MLSLFAVHLAQGKQTGCVQLGKQVGQCEPRGAVGSTQVRADGWQQAVRDDMMKVKGFREGELACAGFLILSDR